MGPWVHSLRWLGATINCLVNSVAMLQQAAALELWKPVRQSSC